MPTGAALGLLNGFISLKLNIAPMIETLGMMLVLQGLALVVTGGSSYAFDCMSGAVLILAVGLDGLQSMEKARKNAAKK